MKIKLPVSYIISIALFLIATLLLGELGSFYEKFWWWDKFLHLLSAIGFSMTGFLMVLLLLSDGDLKASPKMTALMSFSISVALGALWEIFEYQMDTRFGFNMQKSGLVDTMQDLMVNTVGASVGALAGIFHQHGKQLLILTSMLDKFIKENKGK